MSFYCLIRWIFLLKKRLWCKVFSWGTTRCRTRVCKNPNRRSWNEIGNKSEESIKAEAELLTSFTNNIQKLATESATLNLSRSILYRLNESLYNNVSKEQIELFQMVANKLIELQEKEFEAKLMSEKSKILADLNSAISEL